MRSWVLCFWIDTVLTSRALFEKDNEEDESEKENAANLSNSAPASIVSSSLLGTFEVMALSALKQIILICISVDIKLLCLVCIASSIKYAWHISYFCLFYCIVLVFTKKFLNAFSSQQLSSMFTDFIQLSVCLHSKSQSLTMWIKGRGSIGIYFWLPYRVKSFVFSF